MKNKRYLISLAGIALLSLAFLFLNFRLAANLNQTGTLIFTTDMGENMPASMRRNDKIQMLMIGKGPLVRALQKTLTEKMDEAGMAEIEPVQALEPGSQNPVLVVKVDRPDPFWMPFLALSQFSLQAGYASDGDTSFMEVIKNTRTSVGKKDAAMMYAEFDVNDYSLGLISRPGYHQYLADYFAEEIVAALKDVYNA